MSARQRRVPAGQRRSASRLIAVQALYQLELAGGTPDFAIVQAQEFAQRFGEEPDEIELVGADPTMIKDLVHGVVGRCADIDRVIDGALSEERSVDRLEALLRITLRAGTYELLHRSDIDPPVVINEYVDIAKAFFGNKEPALVNGVLDRLAYTLASDENAGADG
jgi:N utilization substance protein B